MAIEEHYKYPVNIVNGDIQQQRFEDIGKYQCSDPQLLSMIQWHI